MTPFGDHNTEDQDMPLPEYPPGYVHTATAGGPVDLAEKVVADALAVNRGLLPGVQAPALVTIASHYEIGPKLQATIMASVMFAGVSAIICSLFM